MNLLERCFFDSLVFCIIAAVFHLGERCLVLKSCRHPVLEALEDCNFIPNDVNMGESLDGGFFLLTSSLNALKCNLYYFNF